MTRIDSDTGPPLAPVRSEDTGKTRVLGVDITRALALLGMLAVHSFGTFTDAGTVTRPYALAAGRSAATFVLVAGVSLAFLSGGQNRLQGTRRTAAAAGIAARAALIGVIGLLLGYMADSVDIILVHYAVLFLLAIPLLGLRPRALAGLAAALALIGPVLLVATAGLGLPYSGQPETPNLGTLFNPAGLLALLFVTGFYPLVAYMSYICAGLAIGRLDLSSRRVATRLLVGGLVLAVLSRVVSWVLLYPFGGLEKLVAVSPGSDSGVPIAQQLLWEPQQGSSWWYLALPSPHSNTPIDMAHTIGFAMALLGAMLLLSRIAAAARVLRPLVAVGTMTLTLYSAHVVFLQTGVLGDSPTALYLLMVVAAIVFAVLWRRRYGQGPMERLVANVAGRTRRAAAQRAVTRERAREAAVAEAP